MEENISLEEITDAIRGNWTIIVISTLVITLFTAIITLFIIEPKYETSSKVYVGKEYHEELAYNNDDIYMYQRLMKTYGEVVKSKEVINEAINKLGLNLKASDVIDGLTVSPISETSMLQIKYISESPVDALNIVLAIRESFIKKAKTLVPNADIKTIEEPEYSTIPVKPNKVLNIAIGFILGVITGFGIIAARLFLDNTYKTKETLENNINIPVLGVIPQHIE